MFHLKQNLGAVIASGPPGAPHHIEYAFSGSLDGAPPRRVTVRNRRNDLLRFGLKCHGTKGLFEVEGKLGQYGLLPGSVNVGASRVRV